MNFWLIDEIKRKQLLHSWALNWRDFTNQPIDEIYSYFGPKVSNHIANCLLLVCLIFEQGFDIFADCGIFCFSRNVYTMAALSSCLRTHVAVN